MSGECVVIGPQGRVFPAEEAAFDGRMRHFLQGPADLIRGSSGGSANAFRFDLTYAGQGASRQSFLTKASDILFDPVTRSRGSLARWQGEGMTYTATPLPGSGGSTSYTFKWFFRGGGSDAPIRAALEDARGWARAGIRIALASQQEAMVEVQIVPSIPQYPQAAGVYRWGQGNKPEILLVAQYMTNAGFNIHLVNHEMGHAIIRCTDMIPARGFPEGSYSGIMDYTGTETWPIDREVEDAKNWLLGNGVLA